VPLVAVKIIPERKEGGRPKKDIIPERKEDGRPKRVIIPERKEGGRPKRDIADSRTTRTTAPPITTNALPLTPHMEKMVTVLSKVTYIYRQGTIVQATKGQKIYLSSSDDDGMCGIAGRFQENKEFILKMSRSNPSNMEVHKCDFFLNKNLHPRLPDPDTFFKKLDLCHKKKKNWKSKNKNNLKNKDRKKH
jgi:hypothetical protein